MPSTSRVTTVTREVDHHQTCLHRSRTEIYAQSKNVDCGLLPTLTHCQTPNSIVTRSCIITFTFVVFLGYDYSLLCCSGFKDKTFVYIR